MYKENRVFEFTIINPKKPSYIFPEMFTYIIAIFVNLGFLYLLVLGFKNELRIYKDYTLFVYFICFILFVFGTIYLGHKAFERYFLKKYLSKARVHIKDSNIYITLKSDYNKFNASYNLKMEELKSYCVSNTTTRKSISQNTRVKNVGIQFVTNSDKVTLYLYDYRYFPFDSLSVIFSSNGSSDKTLHYTPFEQIEGIERFSKFIKYYITEYNKRYENNIKHSTPAKWKKHYRELIRILLFIGIIGVVILTYIILKVII